MKIRKATNKDKDKLFDLFKECFGDIAFNNGALDWIEGRYVVAETIGENPRIVAVSGILNEIRSDYNGYEITWTCTTEKYRKQGLIIEILKSCIDKLPNDNIPIYCSCWRMGNSEQINLKSVMNYLGGVEVIKERITRRYPHNKECYNCPHEKNNCICFDDLYVIYR